MPYVNKEAKERMAENLLGADDHFYPDPKNIGELNFVITSIVTEYMERQPKFNYETLNGVYGAMQLAAAEFKRRLIDPYEDTKIAENGDVYPPSLLGKANGVK